MIKTLRIENYAIIQKVELNFDASLNIITGETGAGKSIILGALSLIMGQRADSKVLYNTDQKCIVEVTFSNYPKHLNKVLEEADYDVEDELIIRREISTSGKSRAFVNDTPSKLGFVQKLCIDLIDLNSQFEITEIQNPKFHLNIIDALASNQKLLAKYQENYSLFKSKQKALAEIETMESSQIKEMDFIKFQFDELKKAGLESGELNALEGEVVLLEKSEDIKLLMDETKFIISDAETNVKETVKSLYYKWDALGEAHQDIKLALDKFLNLDEQLEDIIEIADDINSKAEADPKRLTEVQNRLDTIYGLQRKHSVNTDEALIHLQNELEAKILAFDNSSTNKELLRKEIEDLRSILSKLSNDLTVSRQKVFKKLEKEVNKKLDLLSMASAEIKVDNKQSDEFKSDGKDIINILFKANKGGAFLPIKKVASGGESARLMLSIKSTVAHVMQLPTMIFDEIDTGVSGDVAGKMGDILKDLSGSHQLISITHSPQVASRAVKHFFVYKEDKAKRTITHVKVIEGESRVTEIAKMLSGNPPSTFALENAKELIDHK